MMLSITLPARPSPFSVRLEKQHVRQRANDKGDTGHHQDEDTARGDGPLSSRLLLTVMKRHPAAAGQHADTDAMTTEVTTAHQ